MMRLEILILSVWITYQYVLCLVRVSGRVMGVKGGVALCAGVGRDRPARSHIPSELSTDKHSNNRV